MSKSLVYMKSSNLLCKKCGPKITVFSWHLILGTEIGYCYQEIWEDYSHLAIKVAIS